MSEMPPKPEHQPADPLLEALRHLPVRAMDDSAERRLARQARATFVRSAGGSEWGASTAGTVGRIAMPVFLAGIVGLYMTWAIAAATAVVH